MKISVVICTKDRRDDLKTTLTEFYKQRYDNFEVIVIDNASEDGTDEMIRNDFPEVSYTYLPVNIDILAQNIGVYEADGEIIWRTDSDSFPEDYNTFQTVVNIFKNHQNIDIISTTEVLVKKDYYAITPTSLDMNSGNDEVGYKVTSFQGPGSAIRKKVFEKIGGYWEFGMEEIDFSTRALKAGFVIRYFPKIRTLHNTSNFDRNKSERWIKISNQMIRYIIKYYPASRLYNALLCYYFELVSGIARMFPVGSIFQNSIQMISTMVKTYRNERDPLNRQQFKEIIKPDEYYKSFFKAIKQMIK